MVKCRRHQPSGLTVCVIDLRIPYVPTGIAPRRARDRMDGLIQVWDHGIKHLQHNGQWHNPISVLYIC